MERVSRCVSMCVCKRERERERTAERYRLFTQLSVHCPPFICVCGEDNMNGGTMASLTTTCSTPSPFLSLCLSLTYAFPASPSLPLTHTNHPHPPPPPRVSSLLVPTLSSKNLSVCLLYDLRRQKFVFRFSSRSQSN